MHRLLRNLVLIACCAHLAACAAAGTGPITLSAVASEFFRDRKADGSCLDFFVSEDGATITCEKGKGRPSRYQAYPVCKWQSGLRCFAFAKDGEVVWQGPVTFAERIGPTRAEMHSKMPQAGLRIETNRGPLTVVDVRGLAVSVKDSTGNISTWCGGTFNFDNALGSRGPAGDGLTSCEPDALSKIWKLGMNSWHQFSEEGEKSRWSSMITYIGQDIITIGNEVLQIEKYKYSRAGIAGRNVYRQFDHILWYAPAVGFVVRRDAFARDPGPADVEPFVATKIVRP